MREITNQNKNTILQFVFNSFAKLIFTLFVTLFFRCLLLLLLKWIQTKVTLAYTPFGWWTCAHRQFNTLVWSYTRLCPENFYFFSWMLPSLFSPFSRPQGMLLFCPVCVCLYYTQQWNCNVTPYEFHNVMALSHGNFFLSLFFLFGCVFLIWFFLSIYDVDSNGDDTARSCRKKNPYTRIKMKREKNAIKSKNIQLINLFKWKLFQ